MVPALSGREKMEFSVSNAIIYHHDNLLLLPSWGWSGGKLLLAGGNSELCSVTENNWEASEPPGFVYLFFNFYLRRELGAGELLSLPN